MRRNYVFENGLVGNEMGHRFKHIATWHGLQVYGCEKCGELSKRGDTIVSKCVGSWD
jgi:hypothetical protein